MRKLFDTHKKGAIPSKVTAIVAACAMLLTVTVTGTAVALESAADPANQNDQSQTVQQNDGTAADAQTANDAATDQTANGTEATQPTDGNAQGDAVQSDGTAQNDATAETDPAQSGDAAQQGDATTQQDATENNDATATTDIAKQVAPAPAADASVARASVPQIIPNVPSTNSKIHVNLFDYDVIDRHSGNVNYYNCSWQGRCDQHPFTFSTGDTGHNGNYDYNYWTGSNGGVRQGIVTDNLSRADGYPVLRNPGNSTLEYLFNPDTADNTNGVTLKGTDVDGLFRQDTDGYYYYDSKDNFAHYNSKANKFDLYDGGRFTSLDANGKLPGSAGAFMPFNTLSNRTSSYGGATGYQFNEGDNYYFGMTVGTSFFMPENGQINGKDMVFEFEGDDDVWVYVDGKLVLDLGGIHDNYGGSINFHDGTVNVNDGHAGTQKSLSQILGSNWQDPYQTHTLKVFYMERGAGSSNCKFKFNLASIPDGTINIGKKITNTNTASFSDAKFTMKVETGTSNADLAPYSNAPYQLFTLDGNEPVLNAQGENAYTTSADGTFTLKHGQYATLVGDDAHPITKTTYYKVSELGASDYGSDYTFDLGNTGVTDQNGQDLTAGVIGSSETMQVYEHPFAVVNNSLTKKDKYAFEVGKAMAKDQTAPEGAEFTIHVTNGDGVAYSGDYYLVTDGTLASKPSTTTNGDITLKAGQQACLLEVPVGTTFVVKETGLNTDTYQDPTYSGDGTYNSDTKQYTVTVAKSDSNKTYTATVTNSLKTAKLTLVKKVDNNYAGKWGATPDAWKLTATTYEGEKDPGFSGVPSENVAGQSSDTALAVPQHEVPAGKYWIDENSNFDYRHSSFPNEEYPYSSGYQMSLTNCTAADGKGVTFDKDAETVTLKAGQDVTCIVTNTALPGSVTWSKTDAADKRLGGSEWTLVGPDGKPSVTVKDKYDGQDGALDTDTRPGEFKVENLHWGQYTLTESKAPEGFAMSKDSTTFAVVPAYQQGDSNYAASDPAQPGKDPSVCTIAPMDSSTLVQSSGALDVNCPAVVNYPAVSSLPLTGGTTGRQWLMAGGGMGFAALLAGAGYTIWRKRQLV